MVEVSVVTGELRLSFEDPLIVLVSTPPLFVTGSEGRSAWDTLLSELRLSGAIDPSAIDIIKRGLLDARLAFFRRLGDARVSALSDVPFYNNPINTEQSLRALASSVEVMLVRKDLLRKMRSVFADGNSALQAYNDEGLVREQPEIDIETEIERLTIEIQEAFELLDGSETIGSETQGLSVMTISAPTTPPLPGSTIWPGLRLKKYTS